MNKLKLQEFLSKPAGQFTLVAVGAAIGVFIGWFQWKRKKRLGNARR